MRAREVLFPGVALSTITLSDDSVGNVFEVLKAATSKALALEVICYFLNNFVNDLFSVGLRGEVFLNDALHALDEEFKFVLAILGSHVQFGKFSVLGLLLHDLVNKGVDVGAWSELHSTEGILEDLLHHLLSIWHVLLALLDSADVLFVVLGDELSGLRVTDETPVFWIGALGEFAGRDGRDDVVVDHLDNDGGDNIVDEVLLVLRFGLGKRNWLNLWERVLVVHDAGKDHIHVEDDVTDRFRGVDVDLGERRSGHVRAARLWARWHAGFGVAAASALSGAGLGEAHGRRSSALHGKSVSNSEESAASERDFEHCSDRFCDYYISKL